MIDNHEILSWQADYKKNIVILFHFSFRLANMKKLKFFKQVDETKFGLKMYSCCTGFLLIRQIPEVFRKCLSDVFVQIFLQC